MKQFTSIFIFCFLSIASPLSAESFPYDEAFQQKIAGQIADFDRANTRITLYSISPGLDRVNKSDQTIQGYPILGSVEISSSDEKSLLLQTFSKGIQENKSGYARCFFPRHAMRITERSRNIDFIICFECRRTDAYGFPVPHFSSDASPRKIFNQILQAHGVKLDAP